MKKAGYGEELYCHAHWGNIDFPDYVYGSREELAGPDGPSLRGPQAIAWTSSPSGGSFF